MRRLNGSRKPGEQVGAFRGCHLYAELLVEQLAQVRRVADVLLVIAGTRHDPVLAVPERSHLSGQDPRRDKVSHESRVWMPM